MVVNKLLNNLYGAFYHYLRVNLFKFSLLFYVLQILSCLDLTVMSAE